MVCFTVSLVAYVISYFVFTEKETWVISSHFGIYETITVRACRYPWMTSIFSPLAKVESFIVGEDVEVLQRIL